MAIGGGAEYIKKLKGLKFLFPSLSIVDANAMGLGILSLISSCEVCPLETSLGSILTRFFILKMV